MKIFLKKFTNLFNFKILTIVFITAFLLIPTKGFCNIKASTSGTARVVILASRDNIITQKTNTKEVSFKNKTQINNIEILNF